MNTKEGKKTKRSKKEGKLKKNQQDNDQKMR